MVNKAELAAEVAERLAGGDPDARQYVDAVFDVIMSRVAAGERVQIVGFGTFDSVQRAARTGRNPRTGAPIQVKAAVAPRFHAGQTFRAQVTDGSPVAAPVPAAEAKQDAATPTKAKKAKASKAVTAAVEAESQAKAAETVAEKPAKASKAADRKPAKAAKTVKTTKGKPTKTAAAAKPASGKPTKAAKPEKAKPAKVAKVAKVAKAAKASKKPAKAAKSGKK